jgi:AcrR family transcriptional regulator
MENKTAKESRKIRYTKMVLRDSLIELMREKPVTQIAIKEICDVADIGRTTFYAHYRDQYDLLRQIEDKTFIELEKIVQPHINAAQKSKSKEALAVLRDLLQYIATNSNSIQVLLSENGDSNFQKKFLSKGLVFSRQFTDAAGIKSPDGEAARYGFVFLIGGVLALVQVWLKNGMDTPAPDMAKMLARFTREGLM